MGSSTPGPARSLPGLLRLLTPRGRTFWWGGLVLLVAAVLTGLADLAAPGLLLMVLAIGSAWLVSRQRARLMVSRTVEPARLGVGEVFTDRLVVSGTARGVPGQIWVREQLPAVLGGPVLVPIRGLGGAEPVDAQITGRAQFRGRWEVGPLTVTTMDPLGLARCAAVTPGSTSILVRPDVVGLQGRVGALGGFGHDRASAWGQGLGSTDLDYLTRDYRRGDPLRRVHWRSSMRRGRLMVRPDEQVSAQPSTTVVVDLRAAPHLRGGPSGSFEWVICAAASIAKHLSESGFAVRVCTGQEDSASSAQADPEALLDSLAVAVADEPGVLVRAWAGATSHPGSVVAILADPDSAALNPVLLARRSGAEVVVLVVDTASWIELPPARRTQVNTRLDKSMALLAAAGIPAVVCNQERGVSEGWAELVQETAHPGQVRA